MNTQLVNIININYITQYHEFVMILLIEYLQKKSFSNIMISNEG